MRSLYSAAGPALRIMTERYSCLSITEGSGWKQT